MAPAPEQGFQNFSAPTPERPFSFYGSVPFDLNFAGSAPASL